MTSPGLLYFDILLNDAIWEGNDMANSEMQVIVLVLKFLSNNMHV